MTLSTDAAGKSGKGELAWAGIASNRRIFDLSLELASDMAVHPSHPAFTFTLVKRHGDRYRENGYSFANDLMVLSGHHGTHIDAIGHVSVYGKLHGDIDAFEAQQGGVGLTRHDISQLSPLFGRGVLIDVARHKAVDELSPGEEITLTEVEKILARTNLEVGCGDIVVFRTGWSRRWRPGANHMESIESQPGPGEPVARWLAGRGVAAAGSDTMVFECLKTGQNALPVHAELLCGSGIPLIEMMNLDELSEADIHEFLFVALPLRIRGGTGSPIRPIAVV
jgi:kynurenine formamidase